MAMTAAERARRYRARKRVREGTENLVLVGRGNTASRKHGAFSADLVPSGGAPLPSWCGDPAFADTVERYVLIREQRKRIADYVASLSVEQSVTPRRAGSSAPIEILRQWLMSEQTVASSLAITPVQAARVARSLRDAQAPDLALLAQAAAEAAEEDGEGA